MSARGKLKIFLGYAAGVGKTYQMLTEAQELKQQGRDVVIGYFESHGRLETIALTEGLEAVTRRVFTYRGFRSKEMDTDAVIARHPEVAVVDEFAHTNVPGSERPKRWEDVEAIRDAGIDVLTSLNIQHLESLNDQVWHVTGIRVRETIPDWVVQEATEVVMVDVTPRALLHRLERGVVYTPDKAAKAMENFFTESNLSALRELALRQTAHQLEEKREEEEDRLARSRAMETLPKSVVASDSGRHEHILIWLTPHPSTAMLIRRGRRVADYLNSACTAVCVGHSADMERYLEFCRNLRIEIQEIEPGKQTAAGAVSDYAREHGITQIYATRYAPDIQKLVHLTRDIQVTIVSERVRNT